MTHVFSSAANCAAIEARRHHDCDRHDECDASDHAGTSGKRVLRDQPPRILRRADPTEEEASLGVEAGLGSGLDRCHLGPGTVDDGPGVVGPLDDGDDRHEQ